MKELLENFLDIVLAIVTCILALCLVSVILGFIIIIISLPFVIFGLIFGSFSWATCLLAPFC